jgi:hypothetical protein
MGVEPARAVKSQPAANFATDLKKVQEEAQAALTLTRNDMDRFVSRDKAPEYLVGDKVWLSTKDLKVDRAIKKLAERWIGPYKITKVMNNAVELALPKKWKIHPVINISRVRKYLSPKLAGQHNPKPSPITVEGEEEFEVERIEDSRIKKGNIEYLVKWQGYSADYNT